MYLDPPAALADALPDAIFVETRSPLNYMTKKPPGIMQTVENYLTDGTPLPANAGGRTLRPLDLGVIFRCRSC
jgi:hypothetical protein